MPVPDYQSLMLPVLTASTAGESRVSDVVDQVALQLGLSAGDRAQLLPSGRQTLFGNRVHWAKFYLAKAGLVESTRHGFFRITERGRQVIASKPIRIDNELLNKFPEYRQYREKSVESAEPVLRPKVSELDSRTETPDEIMRAAHKQVETSLAQDLLDRVRAASPAFFEHLVVSLLLSMGYGGSVADAGHVVGRSGDGGIDGVVDQDALGLDRVYIQARRYADGNNVDSGAIREFFGSLNLHKASKGLFVSTSSFTSSARNTTKSLGMRIVLIDGEQLAKLMIRYNVGCRVEEVLHIKKLDEDFFV